MKYHIKEKVKTPKLGLAKALENKIQHTHYDRKTGKYVREERTVTEEHKAKTANWPKKNDSKKIDEKDYQKRIGRAYNE